MIEQTKIKTIEDELEEIVDILTAIADDPAKAAFAKEARSYINTYKRFIQQIKIDVFSGNEVSIQKSLRDTGEFRLKVRDLVNRTLELSKNEVAKEREERKGNLHLIRD